MYWKQGRRDEAEQLQVQVVDMRKKLFGAEHPDTLTCIENLEYMAKTREETVRQRLLEL
jgi:hypothetical protein